MKLFTRVIPVFVITALLHASCDVSPIECGYTPKVSKENPQPEFMPHPNCGKIVDGKLELYPDHLENLSFDEDGLAFVLTNDGVFYVDRSGRSVQTFWYDMAADGFNEGLARAIVANKFGFISRSLDFVIEPAFDFAFPFENGYATVCNNCEERADGEHRVQEGGEWGVIDREGKVVVPLKYRKDELKDSPAYLKLGM